MKKKVLALLLATAMIATFAGCSEKTEEPAGDVAVEGEEAGEEAITCTMTVWAPSEDQSTENPWLQTQCEAFAAEHPNWDITWEFAVCAEGDAKAMVTQDVTAAADVYCYANDNVADLVAADGIAELGGSVAEFVTSNFNDVFVGSVTYNGSIYGIPYEPNTWIMYYNTSVLSEEDVKSLDTVLEKGTVMFPLTNSWYIEAFYTAVGAEFFGGNDNNDAGINLGSDATKATDYIVDLVANPNFKNGEFGDAVSGLKDGSVIAAFSGGWDRANAEEALGDNYGAVAIPSINIDGTAYQMKNFAGSKAWAVNPSTDNAQVATALAVFLASESAQQARYDARGTVPALTSLKEKVASDPYVAVFNKQYADCSISQPLCANMGNWWAPAGNMGNELNAGDITHENAAAKTEAFGNAINGN